MGFNGDVVVFRSSAELSELAPHVGGDEHPVYLTWPYSDGWQAVHVRHFEQPYEFDERWIADLMDRTGAPVLVCNVFESDVAHVRGASSAGTWRAGWITAVRQGAWPTYAGKRSWTSSSTAPKTATMLRLSILPIT